MKKITIPEVDVEIGDCLFLRVKEVSYYPGSPAVMYYKDGSGHPGDAAEIDWKEQYIVIKKFKMTNKYSEILKREIKSMNLVSDHDFEIDEEFANNYYDAILEQTEEILQDGN